MSDVLSILTRLKEINEQLNWIITFLKEAKETPCSSDIEPTKTFMAKVNSSGMITIPKVVRELNGINENSYVILQIVNVI